MNDNNKNNNTLFQVIPLQNDTDFISDNEFIQGINRTPLIDPNGSYVIRSSSYSNESTKAYNAFNNDIETAWECNYKENNDYNKMKVNYPAYKQHPYSKSFPSNYQGGGLEKNTFFTNVGSDEQFFEMKGEWIEISLPYEVYIQSYSLATPVFGNSNNFPRKFMLVGKNIDSTNDTWSLIDNQQINDTTPSGQVIREFQTNASDKFSTYRIIIMQMSNGIDRVKISQIRMIGSALLYALSDEEREMKKQLFKNSKQMKNKREKNKNKTESMSNINDYVGNHLGSKPLDTFVNLKRDIINQPYSTRTPYNTNILNKNKLKHHDIVDTDNRYYKEQSRNEVLVNSSKSKNTNLLVNTEYFQGSKEYTYTNDIVKGESKIKDVILEHQVEPLNKKIQLYQDNINEINDSYIEIQNQIKEITNEYNDGLQDKLQHDKKYKYKSEQGHKPIMDIKNVRTKELDSMIIKNEQVLFFASIAGVSLLIGMIFMKRK